MGTPYRRIIHPAGIDLRAREIPVGDVDGIEYTVAEVDTIEVEGFGTDEKASQCSLDLDNTIFDKAPFATGDIHTLLDAMLEAIKQNQFFWLHDYISTKWDHSEQTAYPDEIYFRHVEDLKSRAAFGLDFDAIVEINHLFPGWIYKKPKIIKKIHEQTRLAVQGKYPDKREQAQEWLRAVCVPGMSTGRKLLPFLSRKEMYLMFRIYFDICKIRKVYTTIKPKHSKGTPSLLAEKIRAIFPVLVIGDKALAEIAGYSNQSKPGTKPPTAINVAAKMFGKAVGYNERTVRKRIKIHLPDWSQRIGPIKRLARKTAVELVQKKLAAGEFCARPTRG